MVKLQVKDYIYIFYYLVSFFTPLKAEHVCVLI